MISKSLNQVLHQYRIWGQGEWREGSGLVESWENKCGGLGRKDGKVGAWRVSGAGWWILG